MQITPLHRAWDLLLAFPSYLAWRTCIPSCSSWVMRAILFCLHNANEVKTLWLCTHFYFILFAPHAVYTHLLSASSHAALIVRVWECLLSCCPPQHICFYPLCPYFFSSYGSSFLLSRLASCLQRYLCHPWSDLPHSSSVLLTLQTVSHCHKQKLYQQQMTFSNVLIWWMNWLLLQCFLLTDRIKKTKLRFVILSPQAQSCIITLGMLQFTCCNSIVAFTEEQQGERVQSLAILNPGWSKQETSQAVRSSQQIGPPWQGVSYNYHSSFPLHMNSRLHLLGLAHLLMCAICSHRYLFWSFRLVSEAGMWSHKTPAFPVLTVYLHCLFEHGLCLSLLYCFVWLRLSSLIIFCEDLVSSSSSLKIRSLLTSSFSTFTRWFSASVKVHISHERSLTPGIPHSHTPRQY